MSPLLSRCLSRQNVVRFGNLAALEVKELCGFALRCLIFTGSVMEKNFYMFSPFSQGSTRQFTGFTSTSQMMRSLLQPGSGEQPADNLILFIPRRLQWQFWYGCGKITRTDTYVCTVISFSQPIFKLVHVKVHPVG